MGNYSIFDNLGNKIGEVNEKGDPLEGCGCCSGALVILLIGFGMIVIWPLYISSLDETGFIGLLIVLADLYVHGRIIVDKADCSFMGTWGRLIISSTIIPSVAMWIIIGLFEGFSFVVLLMSLFIYFLMSIGGGFVTALIVNGLSKEKDTMVELEVQSEVVSREFLDSAETPDISAEYSEEPPAEVYDAKRVPAWKRVEMKSEEGQKEKKATKVIVKRKGQR